MPRTILIMLIMICTQSISGQVDYKEYKKRFPLTCTKFDSASVIKSQILLDSLNQFDIDEGRNLFLFDIGMTYYFRYGKWKDQDDLKKSLGFFEVGFKEFNNSDFAWNLTMYWRLGDCEKALEYLNQYLELRKKEGIEIDYEQVYYVQRNCCN